MRYPRGFEVRDLKCGTVYLRLPYYAQPKNDAVWVAKQKELMADAPLVFRREILMDETVAHGQPIYSNYDDELHVHRDRLGNEAYIPVFPNSLYFGGWDIGNTLQPAFLLYQILPRPFQVHALLELISHGGEPAEIFAPRVSMAIRQVLPGAWDQVRHFADSSIDTRDGNRGGTAAQELAKHGFAGDLAPEAVSNVLDPRLGAMLWLFNRRLDDGKAGFKIDALRCPTFRHACQGKYRYKVSKQGDPDGPGAIIIEPDKNAWSHVADAGQYPAIYIREFIAGEMNVQISSYR